MKREIVEVDKNNYKKYSGQIVDLILEAFTTRYYSQQSLSKKYTNGYVKRVLKNGYGFLSLDKSIVVGLVLLSPDNIGLSHPRKIDKKLKKKKCLFLLEMAVTKKYQKKRIGTTLLKKALDSVDKSKYDHIMLKTLDENEPAKKLYKRFGFKELVIKKEKKKNKEGESFLMLQRYLIKNI